MSEACLCYRRVYKNDIKLENGSTADLRLRYILEFAVLGDLPGADAAVEADDRHVLRKVMVEGLRHLVFLNNNISKYKCK